MNVKDLHPTEKELSALPLFKSENGSVVSIQLAANGILKEHTTPIPALLLCISGQTVYKDEKGQQSTLNAGDYFKIEPNIKHLLHAIEASQLVLFR